MGANGLNKPASRSGGTVDARDSKSRTSHPPLVAASSGILTLDGMATPFAPTSPLERESGRQDHAGHLVDTGLCACGCGERTPIAPVTSAKRGWRKGEPITYCRGHSARITNRTRKLESKIPIIEIPTGCLLWGGAVNSKGYPQRGDHQGGNLLVHRAEYEHANGPVPIGYHLHHLCETPRCINPKHLIALSPGDHVRFHAWQRREVS